MSKERNRLTHVDGSGRARMVDVGGKDETARFAAAVGRVVVSGALEGAIRENGVVKGDVLGVAQLAGVMGAKRTDELIPMCHTLGVDHIEVRCELVEGAVEIRAEVATHGRTGVEMEALVAVTCAALTVVDMGKAIDRGMRIEGVRVVEKRGGRSGDFRAE